MARALKAAGGSNVVEVSQVVVDLDIVEGSAERADGDAHSVRAAETAELAATFEMWFEFEEGTSSDASFARAIDALQPLINYRLSGDPQTEEAKPRLADVLQRKQLIANSSSSLWELAKQIAFRRFCLYIFFSSLVPFIQSR